MPIKLEKKSAFKRKEKSAKGWLSLKLLLNTAGLKGYWGENDGELRALPLNQGSSHEFIS
jgi:hypothetical protein